MLIFVHWEKVFEIFSVAEHGEEAAPAPEPEKKKRKEKEPAPKKVTRVQRQPTKRKKPEQGSDDDEEKQDEGDNQYYRNMYTRAMEQRDEK